jgi:heme exporter protein C
VLILFLIIRLIAVARWKIPPGGARAAAILAHPVGRHQSTDHQILGRLVVLHQPASVMRMGGPSLYRAFLIPLLVMAIAFSLLFVTLHLAAMRNEILRRRVRSLQMMQVAQANQQSA